MRITARHYNFDRSHTSSSNNVNSASNNAISSSSNNVAMLESVVATSG